MGKPAARMGDQCAHGGAIVMGFPMVLIGGQPAARMGDMHMCPMPNPGLPPPPHVGGPILMGSPTVLIGGMMAARMGDMATCAGPPDTILGGCPTVLIGEAGGGGGGGGGSGGGGGGGGDSKGDSDKKSKGKAAKSGKAKGPEHGDFSAESSSSRACSDYGMQVATGSGDPEKETEDHWVEFDFVDKAGLPTGGPHFEFEDADGETSRGVVQSDGIVRREGLSSGNCAVRLFSVANAAWSKEEARTGDTVTLSADTDGFEDGTAATFTIYQRDISGSDKTLAELEAKVDGGKIETDWTYEYPDEDEEPKPAGTGGFSHPEYFFVAQVEDCSAMSGTLFYKDWIEFDLKDADGQPVADEAYRVILASGEVREGTLDHNGHVRIEDLPPGKARVDIPRYPHATLEA